MNTRNIAITPTADQAAQLRIGEQTATLTDVELGLLVESDQKLLVSLSA